MAIAVIGTPAATVNDGGSYTAETGSNRAVIWGISAQGGGQEFTGATLGGVAFTLGAEYPSSGTNAINCLIAYMLSAAIPSGSQTADVTYNSAPTGDRGGMMTLSGVAQASTVVDTDNGTLADSTSHQLPGIDAESGGIVILQCAVGGSDYTVTPTGYTVVFNNTGANPRSFFAYKLISATGTETPSAMTSAASGITRYAMLSLRQAAASDSNARLLGGDLLQAQIFGRLVV